jgi:ABC-2 type transport system ATP-binding protein
MVGIPSFRTTPGGGAVTAAIEVTDIHKKFRLYHEVNRSFKSAVLRRGRSRYEEFEALKGVSFDVPQGSTFGLVGGNGSGKSTLLKCLARILRPESGQIVTRGRMAALLELGSGFHPELSGRENVYLNASILGLKRRDIDSRFDDIVEFSGIGGFIDSPVKNYSSGMYVRLGFAVAIHIEPEVLLVDEVLAVGDEQFQRRCAEKFADLQKQGRTIVLVSHSMAQVRHMCDHALWLDRGVPRVVGDAEHVVRAYLDEQDRVETTHTVVQDLEVLPIDRRTGEPVSDVRAGDDWGVQIEAKLRDDRVPVRVRVEVLHNDGLVLLSGERVLEPEGTVLRTVVEVPPLPVAPGEYAVRVHADPLEDGRAGSVATAHFLVSGGGRPAALLPFDLRWQELPHGAQT